LTKIDQTRSRNDHSPIIPLNDKGLEYRMEDLHDEQRSIACHILDKIHEWMTLNDLSKFVPLRCTMIGPAGSGKSVLINTITTCIRKLFDYNNVVAVGCPTGTAAFNANVETLHSLTAQGIAENYVPFSISDAKKKCFAKNSSTCYVLLWMNGRC
jgi:hypothetical protein